VNLKEMGIKLVELKRGDIYNGSVLATKHVKGYDILLEVVITKKGDVNYWVYCDNWNGKVNIFEEGVSQCGEIEQAIECYNSYK